MNKNGNHTEMELILYISIDCMRNRNKKKSVAFKHSISMKNSLNKNEYRFRSFDDWIHEQRMVLRLDSLEIWYTVVGKLLWIGDLKANLFKAIQSKAVTKH